MKSKLLLQRYSYSILNTYWCHDDLWGTGIKQSAMLQDLLFYFFPDTSKCLSSTQYITVCDFPCHVGVRDVCMVVCMDKFVSQLFHNIFLVGVERLRLLRPAQPTPSVTAQAALPRHGHHSLFTQLLRLLVFFYRTLWSLINKTGHMLNH